MDIKELQEKNELRGKRWHQGDLAQWTTLEWTAAMAGEAGEACNAAKKMRRLDLELPNKEAGLQKHNYSELERNVVKECADTIIYALLVMSSLGYDAETMIKHVFNTKSEEYGFPEML